MHAAWAVAGQQQQGMGNEHAREGLGPLDSPGIERAPSGLQAHHPYVYTTTTEKPKSGVKMGYLTLQPVTVKPNGQMEFCLD